jgi:hypothetical protein
MPLGVSKDKREEVVANMSRDSAGPIPAPAVGFGAGHRWDSVDVSVNAVVRFHRQMQTRFGTYFSQRHGSSMQHPSDGAVEAETAVPD